MEVLITTTSWLVRPALSELADNFVLLLKKKTHSTRGLDLLSEAVLQVESHHCLAANYLRRRDGHGKLRVSANQSEQVNQYDSHMWFKLQTDKSTAVAVEEVGRVVSAKGKCCHYFISQRDIKDFLITLPLLLLITIRALHPYPL